MSKLVIYCEEYDFGALSNAFEGEIAANCALSAEITFVDESQIRTLNARTRNIDRVTDVLSYPALEGIFGREIRKEEHPFDIDETGALFLGSIAICTQVAKSQAEEYNHSYERELYYLAVHGLCHLLGYDHMIESDKAAMREKEEKILNKIGLKRK